MRKTIYNASIFSHGMVHEVKGEFDEIIDDPTTLKEKVKENYHWMFEDVVEGERVFTVTGQVIDTPKWNVGHFPRGTVCEIQVQYSVDELKRITVTDIYRNGPNSYVLVSDEWNEACKMPYSYNIDHVCGIVSRGKGTTAITEHNKERYEKQFLEELRRENFRANGICKQRNQYQTFSVRELVLFVARKYMNDDMILDMEKLLDMLAKRGLLVGKNFFSNDGVDRVFDLKYFEMRKKKLNRAVKQLLNKCLCNHVKAQEEEYRMHAEIAEKDWNHDFDTRHPELVHAMEESTPSNTSGSEYEGTECNAVRVRHPKPLHVHDENRFSASDFDLDIDVDSVAPRASLADLHPLDGPLPDDRDEPLTLGTALRQYVDEKPEKFS